MKLKYKIPLAILIIIGLPFLYVLFLTFDGSKICNAYFEYEEEECYLDNEMIAEYNEGIIRQNEIARGEFQPEIDFTKTLEIINSTKL